VQNEKLCDLNTNDIIKIEPIQSQGGSSEAHHWIYAFDQDIQMNIHKIIQKVVENS
jgi:hypothetical protein